MFEMRYTVVDPHGTASFIGPGHVLKMLVAACAHMPTDLTALLRHLRTLDAQFADHVADGLAVFDEHHVAGPRLGSGQSDPHGDTAFTSIFRVIDGPSRQASLQPGRAGVVVFNLIERRIIQIQNTYADVQRQDRGRLRRDGRPVQTYYYYDLPAEWRIVP